MQCLICIEAEALQFAISIDLLSCVQQISLMLTYHHHLSWMLFWNLVICCTFHEDIYTR